MAKGKNVRSSQKKTNKSVGLVRKDGKFYNCRHCGAKRKTMSAMNQHHREAHPNAQPARSRSKTLSIAKLRHKGVLEGLTEREVTEAVFIAKVIRNPTEARRIVRDIMDEYVRKRKARGW